MLPTYKAPFYTLKPSLGSEETNDTAPGREMEYGYKLPKCRFSIFTTEKKIQFNIQMSFKVHNDSHTYFIRAVRQAAELMYPKDNELKVFLQKYTWSSTMLKCTNIESVLFFS